MARIPDEEITRLKDQRLRAHPKPLYLWIARRPRQAGRTRSTGRKGAFRLSSCVSGSRSGPGINCRCVCWFGTPGKIPGVCGAIGHPYPTTVAFLEKMSGDPSQNAVFRVWMNGHVLPAFSGRILVVMVDQNFQSVYSTYPPPLYEE